MCLLNIRCKDIKYYTQHSYLFQWFCTIFMNLFLIYYWFLVIVVYRWRFHNHDSMLRIADALHRIHNSDFIILWNIITITLEILDGIPERFLQLDLDIIKYIAFDFQLCYFSLNVLKYTKNGNDCPLCENSMEFN